LSMRSPSTRTGSAANAILLLMLTGARRNEITQAKWEHVLWNERNLVPLSKSVKQAGLLFLTSRIPETLPFRPICGRIRVGLPVTVSRKLLRQDSVRTGQLPPRSEHAQVLSRNRRRVCFHNLFMSMAIDRHEQRLT
jgi:integrase